jgi:glycosyltransferase involved in cell wall biosynthesis
MRILMTADPIGGVWRYAMELCEALRPYGAEVMLATLGGEPSSGQRAEVAQLPHVQLRESRYRLEWMASPWDSLDEAADWLLSLEKEFAPAVIHLNHLVHGHLPWRAPAIVVGHSCVLSWWNAVHGETPLGWLRYHDSVMRSLHAAKLVVAPTNAMMRALQRHYGPLVRYQTIANGLDPRRFRAGSKEPFILSAGRLWDAGKNVGALCRIAGSLDWPLEVAGPTQSPDGETQVIHGVQCLGALAPPALADRYAAASIYALPARYEPFGLTVLEAALSGCALVLGDIDSLREVWGEAARYVPPDDPPALRDTLNDLIADPIGRRNLATLAQARARRYGPQQLAAQYWNGYTSVLESASLDSSLSLHPKDVPTCASYSSTIH